MRLLAFHEHLRYNNMERRNIGGNESVKLHSLRQVSGISLEPLDLLLSVCKVKDYKEIDIERPFVFTGRTEQEKSLVCQQLLFLKTQLTVKTGGGRSAFAGKWIFR